MGKESVTHRWFIVHNVLYTECWERNGQENSLNEFTLSFGTAHVIALL